MAATFNLFLRFEGLLSGKMDGVGELYSPYTVATTADIKDHRIVTVPTATVKEVIAIGANADIASAVAIVLIPSVAGTFCFKGATGEDANSCIVARANFPVVLPTGQTMPYQNTVANRIDEVAEAISSISFRQATGADAKVVVFAIG